MNKEKKRKLSSIKSLQKKAERLAKEVCYLRDGNKCMVQKYFPEIHLTHSDIYQADHCFSRLIKELFLDIANLTCVCRTCNAVKGSGKIGASKRDAVTIAVHEIVKQREGIETYNRLLKVASSQTAFLLWKNITWLEEQIIVLESQKEYYGQTGKHK